MNIVFRNLNGIVNQQMLMWLKFPGMREMEQGILRDLSKVMQKTVIFI